MPSHAERFAKIAERIERELERIDEAAVADARLEPVRAREGDLIGSLASFQSFDIV